MLDLQRRVERLERELAETRRQQGTTHQPLPPGYLDTARQALLLRLKREVAVDKALAERCYRLYGDGATCWDYLAVITLATEARQHEPISHLPSYLMGVTRQARTLDDLKQWAERVEKSPISHPTIKPKHLTDAQWALMRDHKSAVEREEEFWEDNDVDAYLVTVQQLGWDDANRQLAAGLFRRGAVGGAPE